MFLADRLIFLELQKTGGSHICRLLERYANGRAVGKHNRLLENRSDQFIFGSIRNPWDWYVSLWAFGVGNKGAVRARTTKGFDLSYYHTMLPKDMGKNWLTPAQFLRSAYHDLIKPVGVWQGTYRDSSEPELFRSWLKLLLDNQRCFDMGEGYGFSPLSAHAGLLSYRYFRLFTQGDKIFSDSLLCSNAGLAEFDAAYNITQGMIRTESLEDDFIKILGMAEKPLSEEQCNSIRNKDAGKTNMSKRQDVAYYYDEETLKLVAEKDSYLISKFDYRPPI